jgi:hypothetical protein
MSVPKFRAHRVVTVIVTTALLCLATLSLTGTSASASTGLTIASIAKGQIGGGPCTGGGYYAPGSGQRNSCDGQEWCADFSGWVWSKGGVPYLGPLNDLAESFLTYGTTHGTTSNDPAVGDAVYFHPGSLPLSNETYDHVAIVVAVNGNGTITTVGGNENNSVQEDILPAAVGAEVWTAGGYAVDVNKYIRPVGNYTPVVNYMDGQKYCLDANLGSGKLYDGDKVQIWACNGNANQRWHQNGNEIQNGDTSNGTFCLDATSQHIGDGDQIQVWGCNGLTNQAWYSTGNSGSPDGWRALSNGANRGLCLDANWSTGALSDGDKVQLWSCNGGGNQAWTIP